MGVLATFGASFGFGAAFSVAAFGARSLRRGGSLGFGGSRPSVTGFGFG